MNAEILNIIVVSLYFAVLGVLSLCGIHRYVMVWLYYRHKEETPKPKVWFKELPPVTVQLPIFNEMYVTERLVDAVCKLDYPRHLLEIQVLDDSTDETVEIARRKVAEKRAEGFDITFIHRTDRTGYKAGALENGLRHTKNEFVAVFDADVLPRHLLEIQVLDDSTDETVEIARRKVAEKRAEGFDITFIHRTDRTGYKAGALENGLRHTKNEFVAVFDADFLPRPDFLQQTIHFFANPHIGMVQARWEHINRDWSWLTKIQAIMLDAHFVLEHTARNRSGRFFNFNGTAGIWRKQAITDGGGWQHDTLTEDLDLSYRSQLKGWEFVYLKDLASPSELPGDINAFKTQQHRWAKGGVQTALKLLPTIWSSKVPLKIKMEATHHLGNYVSFLGMVLVCLLILPSMIARQEMGWLKDLKWADAFVLIGAFCSVLVYYGASQIELGKGWAKRFLLFPLMLAVGVGMCLNNAKAVMEALLGHQTGFVRTPKHGLAAKGSSLAGKKYRSKWNVMAVLELIFGVYFSCVCGFAWHFEMWGALPFLALFPIGFFYVSGLSFMQAFGAKPKAAPAPAAVAEKQTAA